MKLIALCLIGATVTNGLRFVPRQSIASSIHRNFLSSTDSTPENSNVNEFAAPVPAVTVDDSDDEAFDFDKLTEESSTQAFQTKTDISNLIVKTERKAPRQAQWFPMLLSPSPLDGSFAGDVGFDPIGFSKDKETLYKMREAEIKHCRLAMLAAAGWPLSELWHAEIANTLGLDSILAAEGKAPSVLNGGLDNTWILAAALVSLLVGGLLEFRTMEMSQRSGYKPGNLDFDPLNLYSLVRTGSDFQIAVVKVSMPIFRKVIINVQKWTCRK
mmetsp:Transcript_6391/g.8926  ORF Transcript_6391/g.8926 Transcript_6391/m.8926 type:complete len:271 (+) Transcript_6391:83-895(+)